MKKLVYLLVLIVLITSCKKNDYVTFSGKVTNKTSDSLIVYNQQKAYRKVIQLDKEGVFKDTLKVENGFFGLSDGKKATNVYFKNGDEIILNIDANDFIKSSIFSGKGAAESNFLSKSIVAQQELIGDRVALFNLPKEEFDTKIKTYVDNFKSGLKNKVLDTSFVKLQEQSIQSLQDYVNKMHGEQLYIKTKLAKGMPSPKFSAYENYDGNETSLDDLKGKYVYIDVWATWCKPCKNEIPFLKKIEKKYHDKNIEFVSISIDKQEDYFEWREMIEEKELGGTQLYAKEDKAFVQGYKINGIPRFILIDPTGNIVDSDAPRPSDTKLEELLSSLEI